MAGVAFVGLVSTPWIVRGYQKEWRTTSPLWRPPVLLDEGGAPDLQNTKIDFDRLWITLGVATALAGGLVLVLKDSPGKRD